MFRVYDYLVDNGIPHQTSGKNIGIGWTGVQCPRCGDTRGHCGIAPTGYSYSCLKCGAKGSMQNLIQSLSLVGWKTAKELFEKYNDVLYFNEFASINRSVADVELPKNATARLPELHTEYLVDREFDPGYIKRMFNVQAVYKTGEWKYRLIIPVYMRGKLVTFVGRDVTGQSDTKYKNLRGDLSIMTTKETVYNIDNIHEEAIICEGPTDVWRFGYNAVSLFGLIYTPQQVLILGNRLKRAIICFDNEPKAQEIAEELAEELSWQGVQVEIALIDAADPGELSKAEADEIKNELFGSIV
jgi:hypothetical protein